MRVNDSHSYNINQRYANATGHSFQTYINKEALPQFAVTLRGYFNYGTLYNFVRYNPITDRFEEKYYEEGNEKTREIHTFDFTPIYGVTVDNRYRSVGVTDETLLKDGKFDTFLDELAHLIYEMDQPITLDYAKKTLDQSYEEAEQLMEIVERNSYAYHRVVSRNLERLTRQVIGSVSQSTGAIITVSSKVAEYVDQLLDDYQPINPTNQVIGEDIKSLIENESLTFEGEELLFEFDPVSRLVSESYE